MTTTPLTLTADVLENHLLALVALSVRSHQAMQGLARSAAAYSAQYGSSWDQAHNAEDEQIAEVLSEMTAEFKILAAARTASGALMQALEMIGADTCTAVQAHQDVTELEGLADGFVEDTLLLPGLFMFTRVPEAVEQTFGEYCKISRRKAQRDAEAEKRGPSLAVRISEHLCGDEVRSLAGLK